MRRRTNMILMLGDVIRLENLSLAVLTAELSFLELCRLVTIFSS